MKKSRLQELANITEAPVSVHSLGSGKFQETLAQEIMDAVIEQNNRGGSLLSANMIPIVMEVLEKHDIR